MKTPVLVFIPSPGAGHLAPTVELANILIQRHHRLSVTVIIMEFPFQLQHKTQLPISNPRLRFIHLPNDDSAAAKLISPRAFMADFIDHHKPHVRDAVQQITDSNSVALAGFVVDMFCVAFTDVANDLGVPTYLYFTSSACALGLMFHLQELRDEEEGRVTTESEGSGTELTVPCFVNKVPDSVLPLSASDKEGRFKLFFHLVLRFREAKGILVNTFEELEYHATESLSKSYKNVPPVFPVGPILNLSNDNDNNGKSDEIVEWLDEQPENSVVFLCFGSMGSFGERQIREIAVALERSGHRFLWSLRRRPDKNSRTPSDYEDYEEVLSKGFLERTSGVGKIIGWAPQVTVLAHPSVGGFVSHCGWNSTLESIWFGVPLATWPIYAEQQLNAFEVVKELGVGVEIKMDYRNEWGSESPEMFVTADEIENGIKLLMMGYENGESEIRKKVKEMKEKSRLAVSEGGSSYNHIRRFIDYVVDNTV